MFSLLSSAQSPRTHLARRLSAALLFSAAVAAPSAPALAIQSTLPESLLPLSGISASSGVDAAHSLLASSNSKNKNKSKQKGKSKKKSSDDNSNSSKNRGRGRGSDDKNKSSDDKSRSSTAVLSTEIAALVAQPLPLF
jgi:hypothetical protein